MCIRMHLFSTHEVYPGVSSYSCLAGPARWLHPHTDNSLCLLCVQPAAIVNAKSCTLLHHVGFAPPSYHMTSATTLWIINVIRLQSTSVGGFTWYASNALGAEPRTQPIYAIDAQLDSCSYQCYIVWKGLDSLQCTHYMSTPTALLLLHCTITFTHLRIYAHWVSSWR